MGMLFAFAPFIVFVIVHRLAGASAGLIAGALASALIIARDALSLTRSPRLLEIGTFLLFAGMAIYAVLVQPEWPVVGVRLGVDSGLLAIVLATIALRQPFTLQYAREESPPEIWEQPLFIRTNYIITAVWSVAFAVMVVADFVMLYAPDVPHSVGVTMTVLALVGAFKFTQWYPDQVGKESA